MRVLPQQRLRIVEAILIFIGIFYYVLEQLRLKKIHIPIVSRALSFALRDNEKSHVAYAPLTLLLGIILSLELFTVAAASAAIIAVTVGDSFAAVMGKIISSPSIPWNNKKTIAGTTANALSVCVFSMFYFNSWRTAIIIGLSSALIETLDLEDVDNLIVPLFVGAVMYLAIL